MRDKEDPQLQLELVQATHAARGAGLLPRARQPGTHLALVVSMPMFTPVTFSPPFVAGSETSEEAADSMERAAPGYEAAVFGFILRRGAQGATSDEVQEALGLTHQNGSARVSTLAKRGLLVLNGVKRPTRAGRRAGVYVVAGAAVD